MDFFQAWAATIAIECAVLWLLMRIWKADYRAVEVVGKGILASSITLAFVWFLFPALGWPWELATGASEMFAFVVEGLFYSVVFEKLGLHRALLASLICNTLSFGIGLIIG